MLGNVPINRRSSWPSRYKDADCIEGDMKVTGVKVTSGSLSYLVRIRDRRQVLV